MRRLAILLTLASCTGGSSDGDGGSPSGRADARAAAPQAFDCSGRTTETTGAQVLEWRHAAIGKINPADAPEIDAWICDFQCVGAGCLCADGSGCVREGVSMRSQEDGDCASTTITVKPNGDAYVQCGLLLNGGGSFATRAYVRM